MNDGLVTNAKRGVHVVLLLVALVVVGAFVVQAVPQVVGAQHSYVVLSGSMTPAIHPGDSVLVAPVAPEQIRVGDVITYREQTGQPPITHRVVSIQHAADGGLTFHTKGDANQHADPWTVDGSQVVGKVRYVVPYVGYVVEFANTRLGLLALVAVPFGLLALTELGSYILSRRSKDARRTDDERSDEDDAIEYAAERGDEADADDEGVITLTTVDLRLTAVVLVVFAAYSGFMAYTYQTAITIAATVAVVVFVVLVTAALYSGDVSDSNSAAEDGFEPDTPVIAEKPQTDGGNDTSASIDEDEEDVNEQA